MSQNIHCSNAGPLQRLFHHLVAPLLLTLLTDRTPIINAQRAIQNAHLSTLLQHHPHYSNVQSSNGVEHRHSNDNSDANDEHNDLDLYDEPLFFEESEFSEHNVENGDHHSPFKSAIHAAQLDSLGLTLIPTAVRPDQHNYQTIFLPAIIPIHKRTLDSANQTEQCSSEINSPAIYDLEAILWTLDQINQLIAYRNGLIFNLAVLDSCSSPRLLEARLKTLFNLDGKASSPPLNASTTAAFSGANVLGIVTSIPSNEFTVVHNLLAGLNITLISAQDISFLPSKLGFRHHALQTALPIEYFASTALQHLRQQNKNSFSIIYSNDSLPSSTMLDALVKWITLKNAKDNQQLQVTKDGKERKKAKQASPAFCMQSILNVPSHLNTGEASQQLIRLQNEIKNNNLNISSSGDSTTTVLVLTESHTTRELLVAYQHLINAGILNPIRFVLIKESNLNIVTGIESSMLNTLVIRESQRSLRDFVEYFEQLKADNNLRNPFFKQYWQQSVNCGLNRDCLFDQIEPINTINSIQSTFALVNSIITIKSEFCANRIASPQSSAKQDAAKAFCALLNSTTGSSPDDASGGESALKSKSINDLRAILLGQLMTNELDLHQLSKHFNHAIKFSERAAFPEKSVDVLKFRVVNQAYRFDRIANYLNSGLIEDDTTGKDAPSLTALAVNHQLLTCRSNSPQHSSLTRSGTLSASSVKAKVNWSQSWWYSVATIVSLVGALISVVCAIYFLFTFDYKVGSNILGYMILLGIFLLYVVNIFFLYPHSFLTCWIREYLMSLAYTIVLASMLVKVMNHWRLNSYHNYNNLYIQHLNLVNGTHFNQFTNLNSQQNTNLFLSNKLNSISTLMSMCLGLVSLESLANLVWLAIYPPKSQQIVIDGLHQWKCYNTQYAVLIETDSIFSVLFVVLMLLITMFFSALTWKHSAINSYESRWIMFSCYVMAITWIVWASLFKIFQLVELRDLFVVIANLLVATSILICMFIRKLIIFYKLNRAKKYTNKTHHLVSSPSISSASSFNGGSYHQQAYSGGSVNSYYGSVGGRANGASAAAAADHKATKNNKKIDEQLKRTAKQSAKQMAKTTSKKKKNTSDSPDQLNQDNLDNVSTISAITTTSSIISSVKSYFTGKQRHEFDAPCENGNCEPDFHLSSIASTVDHAQLVAAHQHQKQNNLQAELYPMDVYETGRPNQQGGGSQQPDSLFFTTKKSIFNSNHSLYLMDEKDYV